MSSEGIRFSNKNYQSLDLPKSLDGSTFDEADEKNEVVDEPDTEALLNIDSSFSHAHSNQQGIVSKNISNINIENESKNRLKNNDIAGKPLNKHAQNGGGEDDGFQKTEGLLHTTNSLLLKDIDDLLPKNNLYQKYEYLNDTLENEFLSSLENVDLNSQSRTGNEIVDEDTGEDEKYIEEQKIVAMHTKLQNLFQKGNADLAFLKILFLYVIILKEYEPSINLLEDDKYILFLSNYKHFMIDDQLKSIIKKFTFEPSNIYMRLANHIYYQKLNTFKKLILKWKLKSIISQNLNNIENIWNLKRKTEVLDRWQKSTTKYSTELDEMAVNFQNFTLLSTTLNAWLSRMKLLRKTNDFAIKFQQQRFLNQKIVKRSCEIAQLNSQAQSSYRLKLLKTTVKQITLKFKLHKFNHNYKDYKLKMLISAKLIQRSQSLMEMDQVAIKFNESNILKHGFLNNWVPKYENISELDRTAQQKYQDSLVKMWRNKYQGYEVADEKYFHSLKLKTIRHLKLEHSYNQFLNQQNLKKLRKIVDKTNLINENHNIASYQHTCFILKRFVSKWLKILKKTEIYENLLIQHYNLDLDGLVIPNSNKKILLDRWISFYHSIKGQRLNILLKEHQSDISNNVKKKYIKIWLESINESSNKNFISAQHYEKALNKSMLLKMKKSLQNKVELTRESENFRNFFLANKILNIYLQKYSDFLNMDSKMKEHNLFKDMTKAKPLLNRWVIKNMKIQNNKQVAKSQRKRWERASARGIVNIWEDRMKDMVGKQNFNVASTKHSNSVSPSPFFAEIENISTPQQTSKILDHNNTSFSSQIFEEQNPFISTTGPKNNWSPERNTTSLNTMLQTPTRPATNRQGILFNEKSNTTGNTSVEIWSVSDRMKHIKMSARKDRYKKATLIPSPIKNSHVLTSAMKKRFENLNSDTSYVSPTKGSNQKLGYTPKLTHLDL